MHNKSLTADGVATIVGGRNIGDEYFGVGDTVGFVDLDVVAVGPVVKEVVQSFDEFWASPSAYPALLILNPPSDEDIGRLAAFGEAVMHETGAERYAAAVRDSPLARDARARELQFEWDAARVVVDDPAKGLGKAARSGELLGRLETALRHRVSDDLVIVSPYFVPRRLGVDMLREVTARGVKVRVLTNGLASTDVTLVFAGYKPYRKDLLKAGVELFEFKHTALEHRTGTSGSSGASLHAKTFAIDGMQIFVGSFNFDPRSAQLNTEIGLVIDSEPLARELERAFRDAVPLVAYQLALDPRGDIVWIEARDAGQTPLKYTSEPGESFMQGVWIGFLSILPIESML